MQTTRFLHAVASWQRSRRPGGLRGWRQWRGGRRWSGCPSQEWSCSRRLFHSAALHLLLLLHGGSAHTPCFCHKLPVADTGQQSGDRTKLADIWTLGMLGRYHPPRDQSGNPERGEARQLSVEGVARRPPGFRPSLPLSRTASAGIQPARRHKTYKLLQRRQPIPLFRDSQRPDHASRQSDWSRS